MECRFMTDAWAQRVCLQGKRLRQKWQRYRTATDTTFAITDALVTIKDGTGEHCFTLPPTFQASQYLDHIEEMAAWLRPQLQAGSISLKRCNFMPATEQIYLCQVELPALTPKEQRSWLHWEAARYVPFEPGTFVAALLPRRESGEKSVFLAAVLRERLDAWQKLIQLLGGRLRKITFSGPEGDCLEADFSPEEATGKRMAHHLYRGLTVLCFLTTAFLLLQGLWQRQQVQQALTEAERRLAPFSTLREAYRQSQKMEHEVCSLKNALTGIERQTVVWHVLLRTFGEAIPAGCWLEKGIQKPGPSGTITLQGRALELQRVLLFKEQLETTGLFSSVLLLESSGREVASVVVVSAAPLGEIPYKESAPLGELSHRDTAALNEILHEAAGIRHELPYGAAGSRYKLPNRETGIRFVLELTLRSPIREVTQ